MITFTSTADPRLASLPPPARPIVSAHLHTLHSICDREPDPEEDGFVGYVEPQDTPESLASAIGRNLAQLEGVFPEGDCLVGVVLLGNSGAGITLVCPLLPNHAPQVASLLREHLPAKERSNEQPQQT